MIWALFIVVALAGCVLEWTLTLVAWWRRCHRLAKSTEMPPPAEVIK